MVKLAKGVLSTPQNPTLDLYCVPWPVSGGRCRGVPWFRLRPGNHCNRKGNRMNFDGIRLGKRDQEIAELLLQGCDNAEIAKQLNMARRTVKARFNRLFIRFGITTGIKRVKLATFLYRRHLCLEPSATEQGHRTNENIELSSSSQKDSKTKKSPTLSAPPSTSSRIIYASSMTNSDCGTESNWPSGTKLANMKAEVKPDLVEVWDRELLGCDRATPLAR